MTDPQTALTYASIAVVVIVCILSGTWYFNQYEECSAKGGVLARGLFGDVSCVKEMP